MHPWCQQKEIDKYCQKNGIVVEAYSPLVRNKKSDDPTLNEVARSHDVSVAQVLIRYSLQKGWVPLPKSDTLSRIAANAEVYGFELLEEEMKKLNSLDQGTRGSICHAVSNTL
jgi:diketogulonate reductase-like aldo/keto reductase